MAESQGFFFKIKKPILIFTKCTACGNRSVNISWVPVAHTYNLSYLGRGSRFHHSPGKKTLTRTQLSGKKGVWKYAPACPHPSDIRKHKMGGLIVLQVRLDKK
jgi:hypothetical protein